VRLPAAVFFIVLALGGCAGAPTSTPPALAISPGSYAAAFDAAKEAALDTGYELDRVDARQGVITSRPKGSAGLATPWTSEHTSARQELDDLGNNQLRTLRITFRPAAAEAPPEDLREWEGPTLATVEVVLARVHRPGQRIEPTSIRLNSRYRDPELARRGMAPEYTVPWTLDGDAAERVVRRLVSRAGGAASPVEAPPSPAQRPNPEAPRSAPEPSRPPG
jgi:hypothetical protein